MCDRLTHACGSFIHAVVWGGGSKDRKAEVSARENERCEYTVHAICNHHNTVC